MHLILARYLRKYDGRFFKEWEQLQGWNREANLWSFGRTLPIALLETLEHQLLKKTRSPKWAPVFVVGPPRSGTTLIYQVMARALAFSYFCNLSGVHHYAPALVTSCVSRFTEVSPPNDYDNCYGATRGWNGPCQGRRIWSRWFPPEQCYVPPGVLNAEQKNEIRGTVALIENALGLPFINKTLGNGLRMRALVEVFPHAIFIRVRRDHFRNALSILHMRRQWAREYPHWISARPRDYDRLIRIPDVVRQVSEQLYCLEQDMDFEERAVGPGRFFNVRYEEMCANPGRCLTAFAAFYKHRTGHVMSERFAAPAPFRETENTAGRVSQGDYRRLKEEIIRLWPRYGRE